MSNQFYLREEYENSEMIDRVPSSKIHAGDDDFDRVVREHDFEPDTFSDMNKSSFFERISHEFSGTDYDEFIEDIFYACGQEGDKFNIQTYTLPPDRNYQSVEQKSQQSEGSDLNDSIQFIDRTLLLTNVEPKTISVEDLDWNTDVVDMAFKTRERIDNIEPTEDLPIRIVRADNGELEAEYTDEFVVEAPSQDQIEARVYIPSKIVTISNGGGIGQGVQSDIVDVITEWGETDHE